MLVLALLACQTEAPPPPPVTPAAPAPAAPAPEPAGPKAPKAADLPREGDMAADRSPAFLVLQSADGGCGLQAYRAVSGAHLGLVGLAGACPTEHAGIAFAADGQHALLWGQKPDGLWELDLAAGTSTPMTVPTGATPLWMGYGKDGSVALFTSIKAEVVTEGKVTSVKLGEQKFELKDPPDPLGELAVVSWKRAADGWSFAAIGEADTKSDRFRRVPGSTLATFGELGDRATPDRWLCPMGAKADGADIKSLRGKEASKAGSWLDVAANCPAAMWVADNGPDACGTTKEILAKPEKAWVSRAALGSADAGLPPVKVRTLGPRTLLEDASGVRVLDVCAAEEPRKTEGTFVAIWPYKLPIPGVSAPTAAAPATPVPTAPAPPK